VPKELKKAVPDDIRSIFYASSKQKAMGFFDIFKEKWQWDLLSTVNWLKNSIEACLTYLMCPGEGSIFLRITNIIERLNKEFKLRTKSMEIVADENARYTLLAFICLKLDLHWKSNPIGKVSKHPPFFKELIELNLT
jgi:transposase-like protein